MSKRNLPGTSSNLLSIKKPKTDQFDDWDDDLDADAVEDCFRRATQTLQKEKDVTLLSSYSIFKEPNRMVTSTQGPQSDGDFQEQVKTLQEKYAEKEGEVLILRTNLQNLQTSTREEEERKQGEWKQKLNSVEKENKSMKSELEFKNLEIVNLRQRISELSKHVHNEASGTQKLVPSPVKKQVVAAQNTNHRIFINVPKYYPLKGLNFTHLHKYRDNLKDFQEFFHNLSYLLSCSDVDLGSDKSQSCIDTALKLSLHLLNHFQNSLKEMALDKQECSTSFRLHEVCSESVELLGHVLPFNDSLRSHVQRNMPLFSSIVCLIGRLGKEKICAQFLASVVHLLSQILSSNECHPTKLFDETVKQILLLNPDYTIVNQIISFLAVYTIHCSLFSDSCKFHKFSLLLQETLPKVENETVFVSIISNLLNFEYSLFQSKELLVHQKECECLGRLYKLTIRGIYHCLQSHRHRVCKQPILKKFAKIICLINSNSYDSTQKYVSDFAQIKEIVQTLIQLDQENDEAVKVLKKLCLTEDFPEVSPEKFLEITL